MREALGHVTSPMRWQVPDLRHHATLASLFDDDFDLVVFHRPDIDPLTDYARKILRKLLIILATLANVC
jgi:hypothetical protein